MSRAIPLLLACAALAGCAASPAPAPPPPPLVERDLPAQLAALQGRRVLQEAPGHSLALIHVREPLPLHRHLQSEEVVYVVSGAGTLLLGAETFQLAAGDLLVIPRGTPHAFTPGEAGAAAISVFTPPFQEGDRVPVGD